MDIFVYAVLGIIALVFVLSLAWAIEDHLYWNRYERPVERDQLEARDAWLRAEREWRQSHDR